MIHMHNPKPPTILNEPRPVVPEPIPQPETREVPADGPATIRSSMIAWRKGRVLFGSPAAYYVVVRVDSSGHSGYMDIGAWVGEGWSAFMKDECGAHAGPFKTYAEAFEWYDRNDMPGPAMIKPYPA